MASSSLETRRTSAPGLNRVARPSWLTGLHVRIEPQRMEIGSPSPVQRVVDMSSTSPDTSYFTRPDVERLKTNSIGTSNYRRSSHLLLLVSFVSLTGCVQLLALTLGSLRPKDFVAECARLEPVKHQVLRSPVSSSSNDNSFPHANSSALS